MEQKKSKGWLVILMFIIGMLIGAGAFYAYSELTDKNESVDTPKTEEKEKEEVKEDNKSLSYNDLAGVYTFKISEDEMKKCDNESDDIQDIITHVDLYLYNDGTYWLDSGNCLVDFGENGNYIIEDQITLNAIFNTGSDASITISNTKERQTKISMDENNNIKYKDFTLTKANKKADFTIYERLDKVELENSVYE